MRYSDDDDDGDDDDVDDRLRNLCLNIFCNRNKGFNFRFSIHFDQELTTISSAAVN